MPLTSEVEYQEQIQGQWYRGKARLTIWPPASDYVDFTDALSKVDLSCQMTTDLPDGVRFTEGVPTASGDITVAGTVTDASGTAISVIDLFDPDNAASPLYHLTMNDCKIKYEIGPYLRGSATPDYKTQFDGWINGYEPSIQTGTVEFHVTDVPPTWDSTPAIQPVITTDTYNASLTSEYAFDQIVRAQDGVSSAPAPLPGCVISATMRTCIAPEIGTLIGGSGGIFGPGIWGTALTSGRGDYAPADVFSEDIIIQYAVSSTDFGSNTVYCTVGDVDTEDTVVFQILPTSIFVKANTVGAAGSGTYNFPVTLSPGQHTIGLHVTWNMASTHFTATLYVDGTTYSSGSVTVSGTRTTTMSYGDFATSGNSKTFEAFQMSNAATYTPSWDTFYPHFVCDTSLNPLMAVPAIDEGTAPLDEAQLIAAAECGYFRRVPDDQDPSGGQFRFTNRINLLNQAVGRDITSATSLKSIDPTVPPASKYGTVTVPYSEWDYSDPTLIWQIKTRRKIPAHKTVTWTQQLPDGALAAGVGGTAAILPNGTDPSGNDPTSYTSSQIWYRAATDISGLGTHRGLVITVVQLGADRLQISARNPTAQDAYLCSPASFTDSSNVPLATPSLWIGGIPVTVGNEATVTVGTGPGVLPVSSNKYLQDHDAAVALGKFLRAHTAAGIRDYTNVSIVPDGTVLTGDLDHLIEGKAGSIDEYALIWGWSHTLEPSDDGTSPPTFDQTLNVRAIGGPGAALFGRPGRGFDNGWIYK